MEARERHICICQAVAPSPPRHKERSGAGAVSAESEEWQMKARLIRNVSAGTTAITATTVGMSHAGAKLVRWACRVMTISDISAKGTMSYIGVGITSQSRPRHEAADAGIEIRFQYDTMGE